MAGDYDVRVTPSLLDRLLDAEPRTHSEIATTRAESVRAMRRAVQRDLEWLLNARNPHPDLGAAFNEASQSVLSYGLADFTSRSDLDRIRLEEKLKQDILAAVRLFEPRLAAPTVTVLATNAGLSLRIDARLVIDAGPEPASFDVILARHALKSESS